MLPGTLKQTSFKWMEMVKHSFLFSCDLVRDPLAIANQEIVIPPVATSKHDSRHKVAKDSITSLQINLKSKGLPKSALFFASHEIHRS